MNHYVTRHDIRNSLAAPRIARLFVFLFLFAFVPPSSWAGDWHNSKTACSDCHTQHNSSGGSPMRTDNDPSPAQYLLRRQDVNALCLSCHDGAASSGPNASPDVISPISYVSDPAGGFFENIGGAPSTISHNLLTSSPVVPPGGTVPMILTCTTCHDPHGNANYRNLRPDPAQAGFSTTVVTRQTILPNGSNPAQVYIPSNIIYKSGVSLWCENCHGAPLAGSDHPVDRTIFGSAIASYARWSTGTATTVTSIGGLPLPRVPSHSPADDTLPSQDDQVMCLSCHKAHGSPNYKTLIYADGATMDSTCQECHNQ